MWSKCIVFCVVFCLFQSTKSTIDERLRDDFFHIYKNAAIETRDIQDRPVTEEQVTFYLFTGNNLMNYTVLHKNNLEQLRNSTSRIIFLIHGWTQSRESEWLEELKNAFLIQDNTTVVIKVDWSEPANQYYYVSSINTYDVSKYIADILVDLYRNYGVDKKQFLLVGHSLGGQICGFVGKQFRKKTLEKLPRLVALDPAGPLFVSRPDDKRLNRNDADVVEVIHTDGGTFGFKDATGSIDFFVNGGNSQPGCKQIDLTDPLGSLAETSIERILMCDHRRAPIYFIEAVLNPTQLVAKKCPNWAQYQINYCDKETVAMGDLSTTETGNFYLDTNKEKPYSRAAPGGFGLSKLFSG